MVAPQAPTKKARPMVAPKAKRLLVCMGLLLLVAAQWKDQPFSYYANNQNLASVFTNFGFSVGSKVVVDEKVQGRANGTFYGASPELFLENITKKYSLDWYLAENTLYISRIKDRVSKDFPAIDGDTQALAERIRLNPAWQPRFDLKTQAEEVTVSAPVYFIDKLSRSLKKPPSSGAFTSRIFPLKNSWASDKTFYYRDKSVTFPGVVTTLTNLYGGASKAATPPAASPPSAVGLGNALSPLSGVLGGGASPAGGSAGASPSSNSPPAAPPAGGARFQADDRLNAVVIYDLESRMPMYEDIIYRLDVASPLVEIEALMIDIDTNSMEELGVNWSFKDANVEVTTGGAVTQAASGGTLISGGDGDFFVRLKALEQEGKAQILSRPSVLTINNVEALLDLHQTFHVKVQGERVANLYPVTAGTMLRVTPHISKRGETNGVHVAISIQDGQVEQTQVDDIPLIKNNTINTQAFIAEGQSLLIGGYYYESTSTGSDSIPILGDIPLLGWAFRSDTTTTKKSERMYLITPRILAEPEPATKTKAQEPPIPKT